MQNALSQVNAALAKALEITVAAILVAMVAMVFGNVVGRYFFARAITWADEVARFAFVWLTFIGTALGVHRGAHIGMDIVTSNISERKQVVLRVLGCLLVLAFLVVWVRWGIRMAYLNRRFIGSGSRIPLSFVYGIAPAMAVVMILQYLLQLLVAIRALVRR